MAETINSRYEFQNVNLNTKKLHFLSGTQNNLNGLISSGTAVEGAFYLTTDTHRLYIGRAITKDGNTSVTKTIPIPVNEGITTVTSLEELNSINANVGEFYYISGTQEHPLNILAVRAKSGSGSGANYWVQLNNDTDQTIQVVGPTENAGTCFSSGVHDTTNNTTTYTLTLKQKQVNHKLDTNNETYIQDIQIPLTISDSDIQQAISVAFGNTPVSNNSTTLSISGAGAASTGNSVTLKGAGSVSLSNGNSGEIVITGTDNNTTYTLGSAANSTAIELSGSDSSSTQVTFGVTSGTENLAVDGNSGSNVINYKHVAPTNPVKDGNNQTKYIGNNASGEVNLGSDGTIKIPKISYDANGHICSIADVEIYISDDKTSDSITALTGNDAGKIQIENKDGSKVISNKVLYNTLTVDGSSQTVYNSQDLGTFYSASKIDEKLKAVNAMEYKGTVGTSTSTVRGSVLPRTSVQIGDTYLVDKPGGIQTGPTNTDVDITDSVVGDLYIATGTEAYYSSNDTSVVNGKKYYTKNGDIYTLVSNPSGNPTTSNYYEYGITAESLTWTHVAAGNVDTTYSFGVSNTQLQLVASGAGTNDSVTFTGGHYIDISSSSKTFTFNHDTSGVNASIYGTSTTSNDQTVPAGGNTTLSAGGTFKVPSFKVDEYGHITNAATKTFTLPISNNLTYTINNKDSNDNYDSIIRLWDSDGQSSSSVSISAASDLIVNNVPTDQTLTVTGTSNGISIGHKSKTITKTDAPADNSALKFTQHTNNNENKYMTMVTGLTYDSYGHINTVTFGKYTPESYLLKNSTDSFANNHSSTAYAVSSINMKLQNSDGQTQGEEIILNSNNLTLTRTAQSTYSIDLVWGSFDPTT